MPSTLASPRVFGPDPLSFSGRQGQRYWIELPCVLTGAAGVDERLSGYPLAVFQPHGRPLEETPLVIGLQGIAAPYQWSEFIVPTLLDMGIACAMFDTPFAGERSLIRTHSGDIVSELVPLVKRRVRVGGEIMPRFMEVVGRDLFFVRDLLAERHGLTDERLALFGVSLGALLCSFAFTRDGLGQRLLCAIGHSDLRLFARSYAPALTPILATAPVRLLGRMAALFNAPWLTATTEFSAILNALGRDYPYLRAANPMSYVDRVEPGRRARFLVGAADPVVRPEDAGAVARTFPDGECYVVPGLDHGGDGFVDHVRYYLGTQLGDWAW